MLHGQCPQLLKSYTFTRAVSKPTENLPEYVMQLKTMLCEMSTIIMT